MFAQLDDFGRHALHLAAEKNNVQTMQVLLELGCEINVTDMYGRTAFHLAAEKNHVETLALLLKAGSNIDFGDKFDRTALHMAASSGAINAAKYLLQNGANLKAKDSKDRTPLHMAARDGQLEMIKYLVTEENADVFEKDIKKRTPLEVAKTHPKNFVDQHGNFKQGRLNAACELLSKAGKWNSPPDDSQAPQRFHAKKRNDSYQPKPEGNPKQPSNFDSYTKGPGRFGRP